LATLVVAPADARAASTTVDVTGAVASTLTVSPGHLSVQRLGPGANELGAESVFVSSTHRSTWTLSISDEADPDTPGRMDEVDCASARPVADRRSLSTPVAWSAPQSGVTAYGGTVTAGTSGSLSSAPSPVATGTHSALVTAHFTQRVGLDEDLAGGACYGLRTTWVVA
jgi:hypothetical protein